VWGTDQIVFSEEAELAALKVFTCSLNNDTMQTEEVKIEVYDKREKPITTMCVQQIAGNIFRMVDNDIFNWRLTFNPSEIKG
jgi:hypothetical protein